MKVTGKLYKVPDLFSCERVRVHGANFTAQELGFSYDGDGMTPTSKLGPALLAATQIV